MNLDLKKILFYSICVLLVASVLLNIKGCDREPFEKLEEKNRMLEKTRDSLRYANQNLKKEFFDIQSEIDKRDARISELQIQADVARRDAAAYKAKADRSARDLAETNRKIDDLRKNPIKREDDELIDSFKNKLKTP